MNLYRDKIVGRDIEKYQITRMLESRKSEFVVLYGRRRVGKTFLVRQFFNYQFDFYFVGASKASTEKQLANFHDSLQEYFPFIEESSIPINWFEAFKQLRKCLEETDKTEKRVIFIDEMPWLDTPKSDFIVGLEYFWNSWASTKSNILLIATGSASSWIKNKLINNKDGLHNRISNIIHMKPFTLAETKSFLENKNCKFTDKQIAEIYLSLGGIPYYLDDIDPGKSVAQNLNHLFFYKTALFRNEFLNLYRSVFKKSQVHESIVAAMVTKGKGLTKIEICELANLKNGGSVTKAISELEDGGFISSHNFLNNKKRLTVYRVCDFFTLFYLNFMVKLKYKTDSSWINFVDNQQYKIWQGYAFENLCIYHQEQIKKVLGIQGIQCNVLAWQNEHAQIDLILDRKDGIINICEAKWHDSVYSITDDYAEKMKKKIREFKNQSKTKKSVFCTFITTYGLAKTAYALEIVQNNILLQDLFISAEVQSHINW